MAAEEKSLRDSLSEAFTKQETPPEPAKDKVPVAEPVIKEEVKTDVIDTGDSSGSAVKPVGVEAGVDKPDKSKDDQPAVDLGVALDAPVSLKAAERAEWAKAPKAIQQAFLRREQEVQTALRGTSEARKLAEEFNQTVGPFMPLIRAANSTPMVAFKNLMQTAAGLSVGTQQQKAQIIRDIIQNYGVDLQTLDQVLSNNLPQPGRQAPGTSDVEVHVQKAMAPVYEFMQTLQQQRQAVQERAQTQAEQTLAKFASTHDFFDDLRYSMADLMDMAAQRGQEMTMEQAYQIAAEADPTVKAALAQKRAAANNGAAEKARLASLSVHGNPSGNMVKDPTKNSLRDDLVDAWNAIAKP